MDYGNLITYDPIKQKEINDFYIYGNNKIIQDSYIINELNKRLNEMTISYINLICKTYKISKKTFEIRIIIENNKNYKQIKCGKCRGKIVNCFNYHSIEEKKAIDEFKRAFYKEN